MANSQGNKPAKRPLNYFYLNNNLHKKLHIHRGRDELTAWCYPLHKRVTYTYSVVLRNMGRAFTTSEVAKMIKRSRITVSRTIQKGDVPPPQHTYGLDENKNFYKYMWSEDDIMRLHEFFSTQHRGRPRKDGLITTQALPSARELRAMIRNNQIMYVKQGDKFVPTWDAEVF